MNRLKHFVAGSLLAATALSGAASTFVGDRTDFRDETIYFAITTRFYDGDPKNNVLCWDGQENQIKYNDPLWRGDFKGLIDKLDYIKALGFTAIWITPVVQNGSGYDYHGYHAMDFSSVDLRYESRKEWGSAEDVDFQTLIDAAHAKGMKIVLDIVLQHTGNFGEKKFAHLFDRDQNIRNQADIEACLIPTDILGGQSYWELPAEGEGANQYTERFKYLKNTDGQNHDSNNYWHHVANAWNWDDPSRWWGQIAGDCVDLNTENPAVDEYLVECYGKFIEMGVDAFRIDTTGHIAPLTFNSYFIPKFIELGEKYKSKRLNEAPFYMFGECCARYGGVIYRDNHVLSSHYYTWKSDPALVNEWKQYDAEWWASQVVPEGGAPIGNMLTCTKDPATVHDSDNVFMKNGAWHEPDYSDASGFNVIDFPMHYNFHSADQAVRIAQEGDHYYNDASWNVVYVDSHDYSPGPNDGVRFSDGTEQWAENLSLMFTFRGVPCLYYGSEVEFQKGKTIDEGPNLASAESGRAYFGAYLEGSVSTTDFGEYEASGNVKETLNADLAQHIRRLNQLRAAVPALRKGQYTFDGCTANGGKAYKRAWKDSYALVALNGGATFEDVPAGTYTDIVTGKQYQGGGTITVDAPKNMGQLRILVKDWKGASKQVGEHGKFIYDTTPVSHGGSVTFTDPGTTEYYTKDDAIGSAGMKLSPAGGSFRTDEMTVTIALNDAAVSGWYKLGDAAQVNLTQGQQKSVTFGSDMNFGDTITISWGVKGADGVEYTGSATYKKVDPNATTTIYVTADSAPYAYIWGTNSAGKQAEPNGTWPGSKLTESTEIDGRTFWSFTLDDIESASVIFTTDGTNGKTPDITGITSDTYFEYDGNGNAKKIDVDVTPQPKVSFSPNGGSFDDTITVKVTASNATASWYKIGDASEKHFTNTASFTLGADMEPGESVEVTWSATNGDVTKTGSVKYTKRAPLPVTDGITIYVAATSAPNLYAWDATSSAKLTGEWPGTRLTEQTNVNGQDYWYYTFPEEVKGVNIIFNDNGQTDDIKNITKNSYFTYNGSTGYTVVDLGGGGGGDDIVDPIGEDVIYFYNSSNWSNVYAYAWNGVTEYFGAWPGKQMTKTTELNGKRYFVIELPTVAAGSQVIFNGGNGQGQTDDFDLVVGGFYDNSGWTGVEGIGAEEAEAEFYTLQGVRVENQIGRASCRERV